MKSNHSISKESFGHEEAVEVNGKLRRQRVEVIAVGPNNTILACPEMHLGYIELPGGGRDKGETVIMAALRETDEEAGWTVSNLKEFDLFGYFVYTAPEDSWLKDNGYDEESFHFVFGTAGEYCPGQNFGCEGDEQRFSLLPLKQVIQECENVISKNENERGVHIAHARLKILRHYFQHSDLALESASIPKYAQW